MDLNIQAINASYGSKYNKVSKSGNKSVPASNTDARAEKVDISNSSSQLQKLKAVVDSTPEIRLEVVQKIKARIKMNDYPIENNLDDLMKKMLENNILDG